MNMIYFLIDGENIDATLGVNILKRFPRGEERPRWDRVLRYDPWNEYAHNSETKNIELPEISKNEANSSSIAADSQEQHHVTPAIFTNSIHHEQKNYLDPNSDNYQETAETAANTETAEITAKYETDSAQNPAAKPDVRGLFFLNASQRVAKSFVQALLAIGWQPILLTSENPELKIVDIGIQKPLKQLCRKNRQQR
ncbi:hypothetical protein RQN30_05460 [Arcanobacterium hippocoleae]